MPSAVTSCSARRQTRNRGPLVVSPLSTEIVRMMEADGLDQATAQRKLASRIDVAANTIAEDPAAIADARARASLLRESVILTEPFLARGDDGGSA